MQIEFNGQKYKLETLASLVGFGRQEKVNTTDLVVVDGSECVSKAPVCYVHDGVTYVLAGKVDISKPVQIVSVLTKHVLKKALMSVQSQPIDTYIPPAKTVAVTEQQKTSKAMAALAKLGAGNVVDDERAPRRKQPTRNTAAMSEQTRSALRILEATLSRKEEHAEESDWN